MSLRRFRHYSCVPVLCVVLVSLLIRPDLVRADDVIPPTPPPPRPAIIGFADTHLHQFANLGFGGLEVFGSPMDPTLDPAAPLADARARALPDSDFIYVPLAEAPNSLALGGGPAPFGPVPCR